MHGFTHMGQIECFSRHRAISVEKLHSLKSYAPIRLRWCLLRPHGEAPVVVDNWRGRYPGGRSESLYHACYLRNSGDRLGLERIALHDDVFGVRATGLATMIARVSTIIATIARLSEALRTSCELILFCGALWWGAGSDSYMYRRFWVT